MLIPILLVWIGLEPASYYMYVYIYIYIYKAGSLENIRTNLRQINEGFKAGFRPNMSIDLSNTYF